MRGLNKTYRKRNRSTDVMAFPQGEDVISHNTICLLGDVVISLETAQRQAGQAGKPLKEEFAFLLIHGILHLLGYDHVGSVRKGREMGAREKELFLICKKQDLF